MGRSDTPSWSERFLEANGQRRYLLTETQRRFFERQKRAIEDIRMGMRGAAQLIAEEQGFIGGSDLSEDFSELVEQPAVGPAPA